QRAGVLHGAGRGAAVPRAHRPAFRGRVAAGVRRTVADARFELVAAAAAVSLGRLVGPWHRPVLRGLQPRLAPLAARGARRPRAFGAGGAGARDRGAGQRGVPRRGRTGGRFVVRDSVAQVAGRAASAGWLRPLPELGADLARDGAAARGPGRPAAVAAAGGG